jgi:hypothetical protein
MRAPRSWSNAVVDLPPSSRDTLAYAQEAVTFTAHERGLQRTGDEHLERGAAVWDGLVRIERDELHDADRITLAKQFKDAWMAAVRDDTAPEDFAAAWAEWKGGGRELARQSSLPV